MTCQNLTCQTVQNAPSPPPPPPTPTLECQPQSVAQTCAGRCAIVPNNCGNPIDCEPCACTPPCPMCQTCNAGTGQCVALANNTPCNDGDLCTQTDTCQSGVCVGTNPVVCNSPDSCHVAPGTCTPATGVCSYPNAANRTSCGGGNICCNGACCDGCCGSTGACGACLAFVTSAQQNGNLGGLSGADDTCQARAVAGDLLGADVLGTYRAWLSDCTDSPSSRFRCTQVTCSAQGYRRRDGVVIATNWGTLTDGALDAAISVTELNGAVTAPSNTWTHTLIDGTPGGTLNVHCANWSNGSSGLGDDGNSIASDNTWTRNSAFPCNQSFRLYCFQQA